MGANAAKDVSGFFWTGLKDHSLRANEWWYRKQWWLNALIFHQLHSFKFSWKKKSTVKAFSAFFECFQTPRSNKFRLMSRKGVKKLQIKFCNQNTTSSRDKTVGWLPTTLTNHNHIGWNNRTVVNAQPRLIRHEVFSKGKWTLPSLLCQQWQNIHSTYKWLTFTHPNAKEGLVLDEHQGTNFWGWQERYTNQQTTTQKFYGDWGAALTELLTLAHALKQCHKAQSWFNSTKISEGLKAIQSQKGVPWMMRAETLLVHAITLKFGLKVS